jgi:hypothetical protein
MFGRASGAAAPAPAPLTFAAMDAAAAATTDHDELEAIRLTKEIISRASVSFREHDGVDYLNLETGWDTPTPIWQLIGLMEQRRERRAAFAARHRDQASQVNSGMSIAVENALRTIDTIKSVWGKNQTVTHMMFPVYIRPLVPKTMMEYPLAQFVASYVKKPVSQIGRTYQDLQRTALQKLCDTLMPSDVLAAIATNIEYDARQPQGYRDP